MASVQAGVRCARRQSRAAPGRCAGRSPSSLRISVSSRAPGCAGTSRLATAACRRGSVWRPIRRERRAPGHGHLADKAFLLARAISPTRTCRWRGKFVCQEIRGQSIAAQRVGEHAQEQAAVVAREAARAHARRRAGLSSLAACDSTCTLSSRTSPRTSAAAGRAGSCRDS